MKERPIPMTGAMVRATLERRKTQTRRVVKVPTYATFDGSPTELREADGSRMGDGLMVRRRDGDGFYLAGSPYGWIGDRLWVRETWGVGTRPDTNEGWRDGIEYRADAIGLDEREDLPLHRVTPPEGVELQRYAGRWQPSMPRWASRITLEITNARVERVQDISEDDAKAEGVEAAFAPGMGPATCRYAFRPLWDTLNKSLGHGWDVNPYVWVIEFKLLEGA